jgi:methyltransferase
MVTTWIFTGFVLLLALQRGYELRLSGRNEKIIRSLGGREHAAWQVQAMKVLHAGWFIAMLVEVYALHRPFLPLLSLLSLVILMIGQSLRYAAILSLQWRWTVKIMTLPGLPLVRRGIIVTCAIQIIWGSFWRSLQCPCFTQLI